MRVPDPDERNGSSALPASDLHQLGDGVGMRPLETQSHGLFLVARTLEMFDKVCWHSAARLTLSEQDMKAWLS